MSVENYKSGGIAAGTIKTMQFVMKTGTYRLGQIVGHQTNSTEYEAGNPNASNGTEIPRGIYYEGDGSAITLTAKKKQTILVLGSEVLGSGLKATDGSALTVDAAIIQSLLENAGIFVR